MWDTKITRLEARVNGKAYQEHARNLRHAYWVAWYKSDDASTKTGAVITSYFRSHSDYISSAANHFPKCLNPTPEQAADRDWKLRHIIHAEQAAINHAAWQGHSTDGASMYMPWLPCTRCAAAIVDAGIKELYGHEAMINMTPGDWRDDLSDAIDVLHAGGVKTFMLSGKIDGVKSLFRGKIREP